MRPSFLSISTIRIGCPDQIQYRSSEIIAIGEFRGDINTVVESL